MKVNILLIFIVPILGGGSELNRRDTPKSAKEPSLPETGFIEEIGELVKAAIPIVEELNKVNVGGKLTDLIHFVYDLQNLADNINDYGSDKPGYGGYKVRPKKSEYGGYKVPPAKYPVKPYVPHKYKTTPPPTPVYHTNPAYPTTCTSSKTTRTYSTSCTSAYPTPPPEYDTSPYPPEDY